MTHHEQVSWMTHDLIRLCVRAHGCFAAYRFGVENGQAPQSCPINLRETWGEGRERQDPLGYGLWRPEIMANMLHMAFPMAAPE
jgi:hypothetical protein